jgi:protein SCO1/2
MTGAAAGRARARAWAVLTAAGVGLALGSDGAHARPPRPAAPPAVPAGTLDAADTAAIARRWGVRLESLRLTASGHMLDFRYTVVDARKARPLFERKSKPSLTDQASGLELAVPVPPKTGALRNSNDPQAGRTYFMFFGNPGRTVAAGNRVTLAIGAFRVGGLRVEADSVAEAGTDRRAHPGQSPPASVGRPGPAPRMMTPQPRLGDVSLLDRHGRATTLREAVDTDAPVMVNFIFTSCTTVCPIMSAGFAQLRESLGQGRGRVRLVSVSIDPATDTAERLRAYAARYGADDSWWLLTGTPAAAEAAQRAFGAYRGDRGNHAPATYLRRTRDAPWEALDGLASAQALLRAYRGDGVERPF